MASAKHSEIDIESEGKVLNLRWLQNRKIFVTSERSGACFEHERIDLTNAKVSPWSLKVAIN